MPIPRPAPREKAPSQLKRKTPMKRGKPLRRVVVMTAGDKRTKRVVDERRTRWNRAIRGSVCAACRERPATEAHHIIREQVLRRYASERGFDFDEVRFDGRNRLGLCRDCHANHHSGAKRLSVELLWRSARLVFDFAEGLDLSWVLERDYVAASFACRPSIEPVRAVA